MSWSNDPELQQMFIDEVAERSARLVDGAQVLRAGSMTPEQAGDLLREGHTIKGTGRVMGYDDVASAGLMLEMLWRWIQHGDLEPEPIFGRVLEALSAAIPGALDDPSELAEAMGAVHDYFEGQTLPEELPAAPNVESVASSGMDEAVPAATGSVQAVESDSFAHDDAPDVAITAEAQSPMSAQATFAALRQSMSDGATEDQTSEPVRRDAEAASTSDGSHAVSGPIPIPTLDGAVADPLFSNHGGSERHPVVVDEYVTVLNDRSVDVDGRRDEDGSTGNVIEFPRTANDPGADDISSMKDDAADGISEAEGTSERSDVVVLPSSGKKPGSGFSGATDLGGLVGAVQSWAAEEAVTVNAGRLYGLVDHIVSLRMDLETVKGELAELAGVAAADPFFAERISEIAESLKPIARMSEEIEARSLGLAAVPLRDVTNTLPQLGRYLSRKTGKELRIELVGDDILVDRHVLDRLGDAIRQLVVNAAVHGIEDVDVRIGAGKPGTGAVRVEARQTDVNLEVSVTDDGRGIDWKGVKERGLAQGLLEPASELAPDALRFLLYRPGFSTRDTSDELAGDGMGLAVVREAMEAMNGSLTVRSTPGINSVISLNVPVHQAMQRALLVMAGGIMWGIPESGVRDVIEMSLATIAVTDRSTVLERSDGNVPFASLADVMGLHSEGIPKSIVVAASASGPIALGVEQVVGLRRVAARELGAVLAEADAVTGAALLGGDEVVLLVDPTRLAERHQTAVSDAPAFAPARILIVDDSRGVQQVVSSALATSGFNTSVAASVADALGALHSGSFDGLVVDFSMPRADGVALAHMVRQRHGDLPIVMLSGVAEGEDIERAREAGVDAFFGKSDFRESGLAEKLRELIAARRAKAETA